MSKMNEVSSPMVLFSPFRPALRPRSESAPPKVAPLEVAEPEVTFGEDLEETYESDKPWHVVLLDDDHHTYDYVIEMLMDIFGYSIEKSFRMTVEVDTRKRVIVWTGHLERAEAYLEQIHDYGADWRMESSKGSMSAVLEPSR